MPLTDQPAVQVRAVRGVAHTERPHVAVPALNRAGDRVRTDPRPERLSGVFPTLVALAGRLPAGLRGFGGVNALEPHLLPSHFKRIGPSPRFPRTRGDRPVIPPVTAHAICVWLG